MPEIAVSNTSGKDQVVVMHRHMLAIGVIHKHATLLLIHAGDIAHNHHRVFALPQNSAAWRTHLGWREHRRCYLIKQRLKNMMVRSVNENDFDRRFAKGFGRSQTTKTAADDHYARRLRFPLIRAIDRIEISFVHQSLSQASEARNLRESWFFSQTAMVRSAANSCSHINCRPSL